jgi:hypothetical protein
MDFWTFFWPAFFLVSLVLFAALAIVVTIGGFFNIRSLFKSLANHSETPEPHSHRKGT